MAAQERDEKRGNNGKGAVLRYSMILLGIVACVIGVYALFGLQMDMSDGRSMSAFSLLSDGYAPQNLSATGTMIVLWFAALLCVLGLVFPLCSAIGSVAVIGISAITDSMYGTVSGWIDLSWTVTVDTSTMMMLGGVCLLLSIVAVALWFAVVVRGPCANRTFLEKVRYVWTGSYGDRFRRRLPR